MLETIKVFGLIMPEESGIGEDIRRKHAEHYLDVAERIEPELRAADQIEWFGRLEQENANLTASLKWHSDHQKVEGGLRMVGALALYWYKRGALP